MCENWDKICRMCLNEDSELKSLFLNYDNGFIPDFITESLSLQIFKGDDLPQNICNECTTKVTSIHENRKLFIENDHKLRKILTKDGHSEFVEVKFELDVDHFVNENDGHTKEEDSLKTNDSPSKSASHSDSSVKEEEGTLEYDSSGVEDEKSEKCASSSSDSESEEEEEIRPVKVQKNAEDKKKKAATTIPGEKKKRIRKPRPEHYPRQNDNKCYVCNEKCEEAKNLLDHLSKHSNMLPYTCKDCVMEKIVIKSLTTLNIHLKMHAQPSKCNYCDKRYSSVQNRNLHVRTYHLNKDGDKAPVQCEMCAKIFTSDVSYKRHVKKLHTKEIQCKICEKTFGTQVNLKRHELTHTGKSFKCSICNNKYSDINGYNMHMKRHNNERAHECQLCSTKFFTSSSLNYHMKVHQNNSDFKPRKNLKEQHYTVKIVDGAKQYTCNSCDRMYHVRTSMVQHIYTHFQTYQCTYCGKDFNYKKSLSDHENTHTGAKPNLCKICGQGFCTSRRLYEHKKKHKKQDLLNNSKC